MASLIFLNGEHLGVSRKLDTSMRVGRGQECEIRISDEQASRIHATISQEDCQWFVEDSESLNGTLINSSPLQRSMLASGDLIRIGETLLLFCEDEISNVGRHAEALGDQTRVRRILGAEKRRIAADLIGSDSTSGPVRKLACLYRLSKQVYLATNLESLLRYAVTSIQQVLGARECRICLRSATGRFKVFSTVAEEDSIDDDLHVIASWATEKDEALLLDMNENVSLRSPDNSVEKGSCLAAPVPGREKPLGAVECFQSESEKAFEVADLEFLISVGQHIGLAIENIKQRERISTANQNLRTQLGQAHHPLIGECPAMVKLKHQVSRAATADVTVLVLGESGTGKEVVSNLIHELSDRREGPVVTVNCAAFTDSLLESELFGHEKGAFTGADKRRAGKFESANGGTIFLDEIGELSASCQAKLLRLLEGKPFHRVGGNDSIEVDVRIVAATHRDLAKMVRSGRFRQDLWYRLRVVELTVPPLRERGDDLLDLAEHFLMEFQRKRGNNELRFSEEAISAVKKYTWPGNVRELRNSLERAVVLATTDEIQSSELGLPTSTNGSPPAMGLVSLKELERDHLQNVLQATDGNKTKACEILGITRASLYNKLTRFEIGCAEREERR